MALPFFTFNSYKNWKKISVRRMNPHIVVQDTLLLERPLHPIDNKLDTLHGVNGVIKSVTFGVGLEIYLHWFLLDGEVKLTASF
jgi:hypothetical protein